MALTCNAFGAITPNTYRNAMQAADLQAEPVPLHPLPPDNYRAALLAGLQAIATKGGVTLPAIGAIPACDLDAACYNLNCAIEGGQLRFPDVDEDKFKAIVIYLLNQILCAGV
jgi:hypothetical protein